MEPFVQKSGSPALFSLKPWTGPYSKITAGFTGRTGGAGRAPYESLNCAFHVGDIPEDVIKNRKMVAESLGFALEDWTCGEQVHGAEIAVVTADDKGRGSLDRSSAFVDTDGLLTDVPGVLLVSFYADCVPLFFHDPVAGAVGLAHAGWKGTVAEIALAMVRRMEDVYGSRKENIRGAIGPSIGACCYEVDDFVMDRVRSLEDSLVREQESAESLYSPSTAHISKMMLNLKELNRRIMIKAGILPTHIECTTWCTSCSHDLFFSYRKENGVTGRMASWIGITSP
ncbi:peptidoglycan editing factor PgeF [Paenibacillus sp. URB8-2]|uniref:peptidoglycan editing factor PgeF n=1 Tax=Paenibacillus sp. URB8-2 TaxID=2741301 RepID=UPI0015C14F9B|nr:peptidoglycan editing factor PgeF [Paenibacillus sp. URB8-2]BCG60228.1 laccase domain protein [Paenibacillus sp. URB8-2]